MTELQVTDRASTVIDVTVGHVATSRRRDSSKWTPTLCRTCYLYLGFTCASRRQFVYCLGGPFVPVFAVHSDSICSGASRTWA